MSIAENLIRVKESFPKDKEVTLVAVSKFHPEQSILKAYDAGQRIFGESRVQELTRKAAGLPTDIKWHFIGHLQTNKVRQLLNIQNLAMIESVDSIRLLELIDQEALRQGKIAHVLLEVHVASEETKSGFTISELIEWFLSKRFEGLRATHIHGIMGMASNTDDLTRVKKDFADIRKCFDNIKSVAPELRGFDVISMGMSGDYLLAIEEGSNMVRVGSLIFGDRG